MLRHRKPIRLGTFKRGNIEQQLQKLTKRHKYWLSQHRKCHIRQPISQFIHIFKGLVLNLHRISDLLLYQCFRFSKIEMYTHTVVDKVMSQLFFGTSDYKTVDQVEMLKKFLQKKKLSSKNQKECDQYHLKLVAKKQADVAYPVQDFCGKIYSVLMLQSGDRAFNFIQVSISHQEKANLFVQSLEKSLPQSDDQSSKDKMLSK